MRILLIAVTLTAIMASCKSKKTEEVTTTPKDTVTIKPNTDTTAMMPKDNNVTPQANAIGDLSLDMPQDKVIALLGEPGSKSKAEEWGADGLMHQDWKYNDKGLTLNMSGEKDKPQTLFSITVESPSTLKTAKNMGIGSSYDEVKAAYEKEMDTETSDKNNIVVGSVYGGIGFGFKNGKCNKIFVGAAAE